MLDTPKNPVVQTTFNTIHEVADFEKWHSVYLGASYAADRIGVYRNIDNPNIVYVGEKTECHEYAMEFAHSDELKSIMEGAGVISKPVITFLNLSTFEKADQTAKYRISVTHEVDNFEVWKSTFDKGLDIRKAAGVTVTGLGTSETNSSEITLVFAVKDLSAAKIIFEAPALKRTMKKAGVISTSEFMYWKLF